MADIKDNKIIMIILAIFLPPVAVGLKVGITLHFWINIALLFLTVGIGAIIHGLYIVLK